MATEKKTPAKKAAAPAKVVATQPKAETPADARNALQKRRSIVGVVVSNKMQKTIVVKVDRKVRHGMYFKYVMKSNRFKAHDERNEANVGDLVSLVESRPLSKEKRWVLTTVIRRAGQAPDVNV